MLAETIRWVSHKVPNIRYVRSIPHRILKPMHKALRLQGGLVDVLGFKMHLDPNECVDSHLWFTPRSYDCQELDFLMHRFPDRGVFLDAGSNIGYWSLRFAQRFPNCRIYAIEANPATFDILSQNINVNGYNNIQAINVGISDEEGKLPLFCNNTGNRGGDSFSLTASDRKVSVTVPVKPLSMILQHAQIAGIDILKLDIEGFESRVLKKFFDESDRNLWPKYLCTEFSHAPEVIELITSKGYERVLTARENCILALIGG